MKKPIDIKEIYELAHVATQVTSWYPHAGGDGYGAEATVRGPYFRWLKVMPVEARYVNYVGKEEDDAKYAAAAMNSVIPLCQALELAVGTLQRLATESTKVEEPGLRAIPISEIDMTVERQTALKVLEYIRELVKV